MSHHEPEERVEANEAGGAAGAGSEEEFLSSEELDEVAGGAFPTAVNSQITD